MARHVYPCYEPECIACEHIAERIKEQGDIEADPYHWSIDRLADDYEKQLDRPWGDAS